MRPPICDVCDERFEPSDGTLLRCRSTADDLGWRQRAEVDGMAGHPPDTGWFCAEHVDAARAMHERYTLAEVVAAVRASSAPQPAPAPDGGRDSGDADPDERTLETTHTSILTLFDALAAVLPDLAPLAGLDASALQRTTTRDWSPMDNVQPPWCPFVDYVTHAAAGPGGELSLRLEKAHWSEDDPARTTLTLSLHGAGERDFRVAAWSPASGAPHAIDGGRVSGAVPEAVAKVLRSP